MVVIRKTSQQKKSEKQCTILSPSENDSLLKQLLQMFVGAEIRVLIFSYLLMQQKSSFTGYV